MAEKLEPQWSALKNIGYELRGEQEFLEWSLKALIGIKSKTPHWQFFIEYA